MNEQRLIFPINEPATHGKERAIKKNHYTPQRRVRACFAAFQKGPFRRALWLGFQGKMYREFLGLL